jgi:pentatricopeptide repeat protein
MWQFIDMEPYNIGTYVMLSNMYAAAGKWDDVVKVRKMMKDRG